MAWVKFHYDVVQNRKTDRLATELKLQPYAAVGILASLWSWATEYAIDGDLTEYTDAAIARAVYWNRSAGLLVSSLIKCGFIDEEEGRRKIHDWDEHTGKLQEQRKMTRERVTRHREKAKCNALHNAECNSDVTKQSKSKSKNIYDTPYGRVINGTDDDTEEGKKEACKMFAENMSEAYVTPAAVSGISDWCDLLGTDLVKLAIEQSAKRGKKPFSYVEAILREWSELGLKTKDDVTAHLESKAKKTAQNFGSDKLAKEKAYSQRSYGDLSGLFEEL
jgi:DnaD/phage-associated family protein